MSCKFFPGGPSTSYSSPSKIMCTDFSDVLATSKYLRVIFEIENSDV